MAKHLFSLLFSFGVLFFLASFSTITDVTLLKEQKIDEKRLEQLSALLLTELSDQEKDSLNGLLKDLLSIELIKEQAFSLPFHEIKSITILTPTDSAFRIFNWSIPLKDGTFRYECLLLRKSEQTGNKLTFLTPLVENIDNEEEEQITREANEWLGGLYYQIIEQETKFNKYYTLLAWDGNNLLTNRKYIDVLWFNGKGQPKFGAPIFKSNRKKRSRIVFEYGGQHAMKLSYDENAERIIFDYLVPLNPRLEKVYEYYYPDVTQDAYLWDGEAWVFHKLVDGDESLKKSKRNFPAYNKESIQEQQPIYNSPK